jgi:hypothetical protein
MGELWQEMQSGYTQGTMLVPWEDSRPVVEAGVSSFATLKLDHSAKQNSWEMLGPRSQE